MTAGKTELKSCPFCGSKNIRVLLWETNYSDGYEFRVVCQECYSKSAIYWSEREAKNAWNQRKSFESESM